MKLIQFAMVLALATSLQSAAAPEQPSEAELAFDKLSVGISSEKMTRRECDELGELYAKEKQRQEDNADSHTEYHFEGWRYELTLRNSADLPVSGLKMECRLFYTEKRMWRTRKSKKETEQKYEACSIETSLKSNDKVTLMTEPLITAAWDLPSGYYYNNGNAETVEADPDGFWVRITYKTPEGSTRVRDFCEPKTLSSRVQWVDAPEPKATAKKNKKKK
jgi:hypothetical protein